MEYGAAAEKKEALIPDIARVNLENIAVKSVMANLFHLMAQSTSY